MILDKYFKKPLLWDYLIAFIMAVITIVLHYKNKISLPNTQDSYSLTGDLTNITLTLAGFILTILTVLITFKDNSVNKLEDENEQTFNKFFDTDYYYETVKHLKNCIKSIIIIAVIGFFFKLFLIDDFRKYCFFYNIFGLTVTILTIWRCLLILSNVLKLQKQN